MKKVDFKVDFIGIGVIKAATTWIFQCLKEHPEICGSSRKEIRFLLQKLKLFTVILKYLNMKS